MKIINCNLWFNTYLGDKDIKTVSGKLFAACGTVITIQRGYPFIQENGACLYTDELRKFVRLYIIRKLKLYRRKNFNIVETAKEIKHGNFKYSK